MFLRILANTQGDISQVRAWLPAVARPRAGTATASGDVARTTLFRRILVPDDFSRPAARALEIAADLAAEHRGRLLVLHVIVPFYPPPEILVGRTPPEAIQSDRRQLAARVARVIGRRRIAVDCRVEFGETIERIVAAARHADVIVMATTGRTGLGHLLIGSVAEKVVRHSPVPVLTIRAGRPRR